MKIKSEIIKMDQPQIRPEEERAPFVDANTLAKWIFDGYDDAGKPIKIVDTRNEFEFQLGHFKNSINLKLEKFSEFPQKIKEHEKFLEGYKLVNVCTGGIRCEKATLFMIENGIRDVVQRTEVSLIIWKILTAMHGKDNAFYLMKESSQPRKARI